LNSCVNFEDCMFKNDRIFESTARMSLWRLLKSPNIFTLESSFYGFENKEKNCIIPFLTEDYRDIGKSVCIALFKMVY